MYIQDLTSTDPYGILPVLYTVYDVFPNEIDATSSDPSNEMQQQMQQMMKIMPLMFGIYVYISIRIEFILFIQHYVYRIAAIFYSNQVFKDYIRRSNRITLNIYRFKEEKMTTEKNKYRSTKYQ